MLGDNKRGSPRENGQMTSKNGARRVCGKPRPLPWTETSGGNLWTPLSTPTGHRPISAEKADILK